MTVADSKSATADIYPLLCPFNDCVDIDITNTDLPCHVETGNGGSGQHIKTLPCTVVYTVHSTDTNIMQGYIYVGSTFTSYLWCCEMFGIMWWEKSEVVHLSLAENRK